MKKVYANADEANHAPNENIALVDYLQGIKHMAWVFARFAGASEEGR